MALALGSQTLVVASLPGHGTTSLTRHLVEGGIDATHEEIYGTRGIREGTRRDQQVEVSGFAIPYQVDYLLVRDPRGGIPNLMLRQRPNFQQFTLQHVGLQANTVRQLLDAWAAWFELALAKWPLEIYRAEDLPIHINRTGSPRASLSWHDLSPRVQELASFFGYQEKGGPKILDRIGVPL